MAANGAGALGPWLALFHELLDDLFVARSSIQSAPQPEHTGASVPAEISSAANCRKGIFLPPISARRISPSPQFGQTKPELRARSPTALPQVVWIESKDTGLAGGQLPMRSRARRGDPISGT